MLIFFWARIYVVLAMPVLRDCQLALVVFLKSCALEVFRSNRNRTSEMCLESFRGDVDKPVKRARSGCCFSMGPLLWDENDLLLVRNDDRGQRYDGKGNYSDAARSLISFFAGQECLRWMDSNNRRSTIHGQKCSRLPWRPCSFVEPINSR
jgi:hypothetical protein